MGPSRKRKEPPPNCTLLDFFSSPDAVKRTRARTAQQLARSVQRTKVASGETIAIDSDSDDGVHGKASGIDSAQLEPKGGDPEDTQSRNSVASTLSRSEVNVMFGVPSVLLQPPNQRAEASSNWFHVQKQPPLSFRPDLNSRPTFGVSAPLLEQATTRNELAESNESESVVHENPPTIVGDNLTDDDPSVEFPIGEWAAEDDELVALKVLDSGAGVRESEEEPFDEQRSCPVCGIDLTGILIFEAETHVNQCLDGPNSLDDNVVLQKSNALPVTPDLALNGGPSTFVKGPGADLFTVLMNPHKDNELWPEADVATDHDFQPTRGNRRKAPFYKVLQGMPIAVDAFCYGTIPGVTAYFLSHAHSDHYTNLGSKWKRGPIYCSEETASLIKHMLAVDPVWIHPLPLDTATIIPNTGGVSVTLIEANHCPGSCLFFFEGQQTVDAGDSAFKSPFVGSLRTFRYLHCGDFRASPRHVLHPALDGKRIDHIYLDTTYLDPRYTFSPQPLVISACADLARRLVMPGAGDDPNAHAIRSLTIDSWMKSSSSGETGGQQISQERILVIVGTYSIGKERIVKAIAQALGAKIYCDPRKTAILRCQADEKLHALLTADPVEAGVHLLPLGTVTSDNLRSYLQRFKGTFSRVIGFRPTGWSYAPPSGGDLSGGSIQSIISRGQSRYFSYADLQPSQKSSCNIQIFGVPYSEHSSFFELTCFAMSCDWGRMIPTVNVGSPTARAKMSKWLKRWELEKRSTMPSVIPPRTADYW